MATLTAEQKQMIGGAIWNAKHVIENTRRDLERAEQELRRAEALLKGERFKG